MGTAYSRFKSAVRSSRTEEMLSPEFHDPKTGARMQFGVFPGVYVKPRVYNLSKSILHVSLW